MPQYRQYTPDIVPVDPADLPAIKAAAKSQYSEVLKSVREGCAEHKERIIAAYFGQTEPDTNTCWYSVKYHFRGCVSFKVYLKD